MASLSWSWEVILEALLVLYPRFVSKVSLSVLGTGFEQELGDNSFFNARCAIAVGSLAVSSVRSLCLLLDVLDLVEIPIVTM